MYILDASIVQGGGEDVHSHLGRMQWAQYDPQEALIPEIVTP